MKTLEKLIKLSDNKTYSRIGNHCCELFNDVLFFYYHETPIFTINVNTGEYSVNRGGFFTTSTSRAINYYCRYFGGVIAKNINMYQGYIGNSDIKVIICEKKGI